MIERSFCQAALGLALGASLLGMPGPASAATSGAPERRCGWLINETPANFELVDRDGQWIIGTQGGYQAPGSDEMPDMTTAGWVATNGSYGHGCACVSMITDKAARKVRKIVSATPIPLARCRADRKLREPK